MRTALMLTFALVFGATAAEAQKRSSTSLDEARSAIEASNAIYADLANKNDGSILTRYTDDACLLPSNSPPVCGKENLGKFFAGGPQVHVKFTIQSLYGDAREYVTEESFYRMTDMSGKEIDNGKVIVIWKKTPAGWKMHRDMFSSDRSASKN